MMYYSNDLLIDICMAVDYILCILILMCMPLLVYIYLTTRGTLYFKQIHVCDEVGWGGRSEGELGGRSEVNGDGVNENGQGEVNGDGEGELNRDGQDEVNGYGREN